jgi:hypothetical protein
MEQRDEARAALAAAFVDEIGATADAPVADFHAVRPRAEGSSSAIR